MQGSIVSLPTLLELQYPARHFSLNRLGMRRLPATSGQIPRLRGRGMTFEEHRNYQPGDEPRFIDWRVTARTGQMHIKIFREEHERPVVLALDGRRSMGFGSRRQFKYQLAAEACALIGWSAAHARERVGGLVLGEQLAEVPVRTGVHGMLPWLRRASLPALREPQAETSLLTAVRRLRRTLRPGAVLVLASDFADLDNATIAQLADLTRHVQLILLPISDPLETDPPRSGRFPFRDSGGVRWVDFAQASNRAQWQAAYTHRADQVQALTLAARAICLPLRTPDTAQAQLAPLLGRQR